MQLICIAQQIIFIGWTKEGIGSGRLESYEYQTLEWQAYASSPIQWMAIHFLNLQSMSVEIDNYS